ncbi:hypothetical protein Tco_0701733 [Tanacetum coccineum]
MVSTESLHLIPDKKFDGSFVVPTQPTNSSQDNIRMIYMDAHNTQQQLAPQTTYNNSGHHTITLSNISNIQQLDGSFVVPTQRINSSQHDIGMVYMDANNRQQKPAPQRKHGSIFSHNDHSMYMLPTCANIGKQRTMHKSQHDITGTNVSRMSNAQPNSQPNHGKRADEISQRIPSEYVRLGKYAVFKPLAPPSLALPTPEMTTPTAPEINQQVTQATTPDIQLEDSTPITEEQVKKPPTDREDNKPSIKRELFKDKHDTKAEPSQKQTRHER